MVRRYASFNPGSKVRVPCTVWILACSTVSQPVFRHTFWLPLKIQSRFPFQEIQARLQKLQHAFSHQVVQPIIPSILCPRQYKDLHYLKTKGEKQRSICVFTFRPDFHTLNLLDIPFEAESQTTKG